jgi:hypothetical protein
MSPKYNGSFAAASADCSTKPCQVPGCSSLRHGIGKYCVKHAYAQMAWGHPLATAILRLSIFDPAIAKAEALLNKNINHPGVSHCVQFFDQYLKAAAQGSTSVPASDRVGALASAGVTGLELLSRTAAVYLARESYSGLILSDAHALALVGHLILRTKQVSGLPQVLGRERKAVGRFVVSAVGTLCVNLSTSLREQELLKEHERNQMAKPLLSL